MRRRIIISFLAFLLLSSIGFGQTYSGYVYDQTGNPLKYVNIGIVGKDIGCVSNNDGNYVLEVGAGFEDDTIRFSYIGYESFSMKLSEFDDVLKDVTLYYVHLELQGAVVMPKDFKDVVLGKRYKKRSNFMAGFDGVDKGHELAGFINIRKKTFIESIVIQIVQNTCDTVLTRLNIYLRDGKGWRIVNKKPTYVKIPPKYVGDLVITKGKDSANDIVVDDDIMIALEWLGKKDKGVFYLRGGFPGKSFARKASQGNWKKMPVDVAISVDARQQRR